MKKTVNAIGSEHQSLIFTLEGLVKDGTAPQTNGDKIEVTESLVPYNSIAVEVISKVGYAATIQLQSCVEGDWTNLGSGVAITAGVGKKIYAGAFTDAKLRLVFTAITVTNINTDEVLIKVIAKP